MRITVAAPAKINLWLRVGPRQENGFHPLDTLFCSLGLADGVILHTGESGEGVDLEVRSAPPLHDLPQLGPAERNLAVRAARAFLERVGSEERVKILLTKRLPAGGGLGGGSSDAAAVLRALHQQNVPRLPEGELLALAAELGSDVPFFVTGRPLAIGRGRGERLSAIDPLPSRPVVLVLPPLEVATSDAYRWLDEARGLDEVSPPVPVAEDQLQHLTWEAVAGLAVNDLEPIVFARHPQLARIRDGLMEAGAEVALMAGSGSTIFGVFGDREAAGAAAERIQRADARLRTVVTRTRAR